MVQSANLADRVTRVEAQIGNCPCRQDTFQDRIQGSFDRLGEKIDAARNDIATVRAQIENGRERHLELERRVKGNEAHGPMIESHSRALIEIQHDNEAIEKSLVKLEVTLAGIVKSIEVMSRRWWIVMGAGLTAMALINVVVWAVATFKVFG